MFKITKKKEKKRKCERERDRKRKRKKECARLCVKKCLIEKKAFSFYLYS